MLSAGVVVYLLYLAYRRFVTISIVSIENANTSFHCLLLTIVNSMCFVIKCVSYAQILLTPCCYKENFIFIDNQKSKVYLYIWGRV